jgi:hypothetical protein
MTKLFTTWLLLAALSLNVVATNADYSADPDIASSEQELSDEPVIGGVKK